MNETLGSTRRPCNQRNGRFPLDDTTPTGVSDRAGVQTIADALRQLWTRIAHLLAGAGGGPLEFMGKAARLDVVAGIVRRNKGRQGFATLTSRREVEPIPGQAWGRPRDWKIRWSRLVRDCECRIVAVRATILVSMGGRLVGRRPRP